MQCNASKHVVDVDCKNIADDLPTSRLDDLDELRRFMSIFYRIRSLNIIRINNVIICHSNRYNH